MKEFSRLPVPIAEMQDFYSIESVPQTRPYVWYMFVMSSDGIGSFLEEDHADPSIGMSGKGIALKHLTDKTEIAAGSAADYRLLQFGWANADAVVGGAGLIRATPKLIWRATQQDLVRFRQEVLSKREDPLQVILTANGFSSDELKYPIFNGDRTLIATSDKGLAEMENDLENTSAHIKSFGTDRVNVQELLTYVRKHHGVRLLDLQGGPKLAYDFFNAQSVDEFRITVSPMIAGGLNSAGNPRLTPVTGSFQPEKVPLLQVIKRRNYKDYLFSRYRLDYELFK